MPIINRAFEAYRTIPEWVRVYNALEALDTALDGINAIPTGQVPFGTGASSVLDSDTEFTWDAAAKSLGLGGSVVAALNTAPITGQLYSDLVGFPTKTRFKFSATDAGNHANEPRSVVDIINNTVGSGTNGPGSGDAALHVSSIKSGNGQGEIDGIFVRCENGNLGDTGGVLIDVYGTNEDDYVLEALETQVTHLSADGQTTLALINAQAATAKPASSRWAGFEAVAREGTKFDGVSNTSGFLVTSLNSTQWLNAFSCESPCVYGLNLGNATISFASIATPNAVPFKQSNSTGTPKDILNVDVNDQLGVGDADNSLSLRLNGSDITWGVALVSLGGGAAPTLGTIGGSGPQTAGQHGWLRVLADDSTPGWIPVWR